MAGARWKNRVLVAAVLVAVIPVGVYLARQYVEEGPTEFRDPGVGVLRSPAARAGLQHVATDIRIKDQMEIATSGDRITIRGAIESNTERDGLTATVRLMHPVNAIALLETSVVLDSANRFEAAFSAEQAILDLMRIGAIPVAVSVNENGAQRDQFVEPGRKKWNLELDHRRPYPRADHSGLLVSGRLHTQRDIADFRLKLIVRDTMNPDPKAHRQVIPVPIQSDGTFQHPIGGGVNFIRLYNEGKSKITVRLEYRGTIIKSNTYPRA